jgi:RNA polymerase sigma factor (TIGR02999 family)
MASLALREGNIACLKTGRFALFATESGVSVAREVMSSKAASEKTDPSSQTTLSELLIAAQRGDAAALEACFPLVYEELRAIARKQRRAWQGNSTLNTTALLHEAYLKMVNQHQLAVTSRDHFFAIAATAMRHVLCSYARDQHRQKRGGGAYHVSVSHLEHFAGPEALSDHAADQLSDLGDALNRLAQIDGRYTQVVECRFFAGLSIDETASALDLSPATVKRYWSFARAWLLREMQYPK